MVLPALLLQKPSKTSKVKDNRKKLGECLVAWKKGHLNELLQKCCTTQKQSFLNESNNKEDKTKSFTKLVLRRKINAAMKLQIATLTCIKQMKTYCMSCVKDTVNQHRSILKSIKQSNKQCFAIIFQWNKRDCDLQSHQYEKRVSGPSHVDAEQYRCILTSGKYKNENKKLRIQVATLARAQQLKYQIQKRYKLQLRPPLLIVEKL